jgi:hypothetical protein
MEPVYIAAFSCFFLSAFGYVLYRFWLRPVLRYRLLKKDARTNIASYLDTINIHDETMANQKATEKRIQAIRLLSGDLNNCFHEERPSWYKLLLQRREESPVDASKHMVVLSNTRNYSHARNRAEKISQFLFP